MTKKEKQKRTEKITQNRLKELFRYDMETGVFYWKQSGSGRPSINTRAGHIDQKGYVVMRADGYRYKAHRLAWLYVYGEWPKAEIDHINGIRHDNRIINLRDVSTSVNQQNQRSGHKDSKLGVLGVTICGKRFQARIQLPNGNRKSLGQYDTAEEAHEAYIKAKREIHEGNTL